MDSPHKGPLMWRAFPCHNFIISRFVHPVHAFNKAWTGCTNFDMIILSRILLMSFSVISLAFCHWDNQGIAQISSSNPATLKNAGKQFAWILHEMLIRMKQIEQNITEGIFTDNGACYLAASVGASIVVRTLLARFMGPTWGPSGANRTQVGPMLAPWTLLSGQSWTQLSATHFLKFGHL